MTVLKMISSTVGLAVHLLMASLRALGPVSRVVSYALARSLTSNMSKVNFNTKHLRKGDPLPPHNGKIRMYNMRYCPFAHRIILALNAKQLDYEVVNVHLGEKPEWLTSKSEFGKVPALEIREDVTIYESLITCEYLDDAFPQRPLLPKDPLTKAYDKIIVEAAGAVQSLVMLVATNPDGVKDTHLTAFKKALTFIQDHLKKRGTKFLGGSEPGYADYMNWPWFERMLAFATRDDRVKLGEEFELLSEYLQNMLQDPAVSQYVLPHDALFEVFNCWRTGTPANYDMLLDN